MKTLIANFAKSHGLTTAYSGNKRKMYFIGKGARRIKELAKATFDNIPFTITDQAA